jgi:hypothetical protein
MQKKKVLRTTKPATGRAFTSKFTTTEVSFAAALHANTQQEQIPRPQPDQQACPAQVTGVRTPAMVQQQHKESKNQVSQPRLLM